MILALSLALLSSAPAQADNLIPCSGTGNTITLPAGVNKLTVGCNYHGGFIINTSNTSLDCQGSTLWGVAEADRTAVMAMTPSQFSEAATPETGAPTVIAVSRGVTVQSSSAISNIQVKNCKIKAFKQAFRVRHVNAGAKWLWDYVAADSTLSVPYNAYKASQSSTNKTNLLNALKAYNWEASSLPDTIRAVTPRDITVTNVDVDLSAVTAVYVDHHVTDVTFNDLTVTRSDGPGLYLEFGSQNNVIKNSSFTNNNREGVAVDSSAGNVIEDSVFSGNVNGGIFLYRNCWEYFKDPQLVCAGGTCTGERANYFPRTQGSDDNYIFRNSFSGNGSTSYGANVGVHIASRQSKTANFEGFGCGQYQMSQASNGLYYHEDRAKRVRVIGNFFENIYQGVIVEDDSARVFGNRFESTATKPIKVGTEIRTAYLGSPVLNGRVAFNQVYQSADLVPYEDIVEEVEKRPEWSGETKICSTFGRQSRTPPNFGPLCSSEYLQIMKDDPNYYDNFQSVVKLRISEWYP